MQGEKDERSKGDHSFLGFPTRKAVFFKISTTIPFLLCWDPSLLPTLPVHCSASARTERDAELRSPTSCWSLFCTGDNFGSLGPATMTCGCHTPAS